jgi:hypothetical protein
MRHLLAALAAVCLLPCAALAAILPATPATALAALRAAADGDEVVISAGAVALTVDGVKRQNVVIRPAEGARVAFTPLVVTRSSGLTFRGFEATTTTATAVSITSSQNIRIEGFDVHGDPALKTGKGLMIRDATDVSFTGSRVHDVFHGLTHLDNDGLTIAGNDFRTLYGDAVRGGGSDRVLISKNAFTDLYRIDGNHPDVIQFWTSNTTVAANDLRIEGNVYRKGNGGPAQFIFIGNEAKLPYTNVVVRGNGGVGGMYHGVTCNICADALVEDNYVQGLADSLSSTGAVMNYRIMFRGSHGGTWRNNFANAFLTLDNTLDPAPDASNVVIPMAAAGDYAGLESWLKRNDPPPAPTDPRDAQIAALEAELATALAGNATLTTERDAARAVAESLQRTLDLTSADLTDARARIEAAKAALN